MQVSIVHDYLCPFCYRQHLVLKDFKDLDVKPLPYQLKAEVPLSGQAIGEEDLEKMNQVVKTMEDQEVFKGRSLQGRTHYYYTYLAHQLSLGAYQLGAYMPYSLAVYRAYFEENKNIGDLKVLEDICQGLNLKVKDLMASVQADDMRKAIFEGFRLKTDNKLKTIPILYFPAQEALIKESIGKEDLEAFIQTL